MTTERVRFRARGRILRVAKSSLDADALRLEIVEVLRRAIGFAAWGWPLADPETLLATTGIADPAMWPIVPRLVDYEERVHDHNKDRVLAVRGDPVGILSGATRGDLARSSRYRDILGPHGFGDELRAACIDPYGCWGHLRLYRESGDRPFDNDDAGVLRGVLGEMASALRRATVQPVLAPSFERLTPGAVVLDEALRVRAFTAEVGEWFDAFAGSSPPKSMNARCAVFSSAARCQSNGAAPARARVRLNDGRWVVVEASLLRGEDRGVVVGVRAADASDAIDLLTRAYGLTRRERELVAVLADGLDTRDAGRRLSISRYTVQQHLKSVFDKVGVRSRRELLLGMFSLGGSTNRF